MSPGAFGLLYFWGGDCDFSGGDSNPIRVFNSISQDPLFVLLVFLTSVVVDGQSCLVGVENDVCVRWTLCFSHRDWPSVGRRSIPVM